jgi:hypothetical protein
LGEVISYTGSLVGLVEVGRRTPSRDFAERCDAALGGDGTLTRLWPLAARGTFPSWFRAYVELEATATSIRKYQAQVVPGLLQTEGYARAVLRKGMPRDDDEVIEERVTARMSRQAILQGSRPPHLWAVIDEAVLRRPVGSPEIMREQLAELVRAARTPHVVLQVLPFASGVHTAMDGSFTVMSFAEGPDVAYLEGPHTSVVVEGPDEVEHFNLSYDLVRADALSPDASLAMIQAAIEKGAAA